VIALPTGPVGQLLLNGAPVLYTVALEVLSRPTPEARDHVLVFGAREDVLALVPGVTHGPADTHVIAVVPRGELVTLALGRWPASPVVALASPARERWVLLAVVEGGRMLANALPIAALSILAAQPEGRAARFGGVTWRKGGAPT